MSRIDFSSGVVWVTWCFVVFKYFFFSLLNDFETLFPVDVLEGDSPSDELVGRVPFVCNFRHIFGIV
jgi:hypothetical protein